MVSEVERRQQQQQQQQQQRGDYLVALYELSGGDAPNWASHRDIGAQAGLPQGDVLMVGQFVSGQHLAEFKTVGGPDGLVAITTHGIQRAEEIINAREGAGEPRYSSLAVLTDIDLVRALEPLLATIRVELQNNTDLDPETRADIQADLDSANDQLRATKPNRGFVGPESAAPLFTGSTGQPMRPKALRKAFCEIRKELDLENLHFHDLRHFAATEPATLEQQSAT